VPTMKNTNQFPPKFAKVSRDRRSNRVTLRWIAGLVATTALLLGTRCISTRAQSKHQVTLEDLQSLKWADDLQLSPAGDALAYTVDGDIWLISTQSESSPRTIGRGLMPRWSPNGKSLAYYSDSSGTFQIWVIDPQTDVREQISTFDGGIDPDPWTRVLGSIYDPLSYDWSPDGSKIVFASQQLPTSIVGESNPATHADTANSDAPLVLTSTSPPQWTLRGIIRNAGRQPGWAVWETHDTSRSTSTELPVPKGPNQLFVVDVKTKELRQLTHDSGVYFNPTWAPDGRHIACASSENRSLAGSGVATTTNIYTVDLASGRKKALTFGSGTKRIPSWSSNGQWIAFLDGEESGMASVYIVRSSGEDSRNLTSKLDRYVDQFNWAADGESMITSYVDGVSRNVGRVNIATGAITGIAVSNPAFRSDLTVSKSGAVAWLQSDGSTDGVIWYLSPKSRSPVALLDLNPQITEWNLGEQEVVHWKNRRGDEMDGVLLKPVGYMRGQKYALIVDCYPDQGNWFRGSAMIGNQAWASNGYMVFWPNARAPHVWMDPFKTKVYDEAAKGPRGWDVTADDITSGVDEIINRGMVDPNHIGLYGFSNGGGIVNNLVTRTNRFKCAVSVAAAMTDWVRPMFLHTTDYGISVLAGGRTPWGDPEGYIQLSAVYHLDSVATPMLLADGDDDGDFLLDTAEMYNGLRWFGRNVTFLRYPNQRHGFTGSALKDFWERENAFFDKYLKL
jgi:dipeptidyl aminopeptidase/acylaminoacyl peptidase